MQDFTLYRNCFTMTSIGIISSNIIITQGSAKRAYVIHSIQVWNLKTLIKYTQIWRLN